VIQQLAKIPTVVFMSIVVSVRFLISYIEECKLALAFAESPSPHNGVQSDQMSDEFSKYYKVTTRSPMHISYKILKA
jgi:hypothetical protein